MNIQASSNDPRISVRFPDRLKASLEKAARKNGRSFNTEVLTRLNESITTDKEMNKGV